MAEYERVLSAIAYAFMMNWQQAYLPMQSTPLRSAAFAAHIFYTVAVFNLQWIRVAKSRLVPMYKKVKHSSH